MGIASLVIGIIAVILGVVPFCGIIALVPAIIGLILGIVEVVRKAKSGEKKGVAIAGIVLCSIAIVFIIGYYAVVLTAGVTNELTNIANELNNSNYNYNYSL